MQWEFDSIAVSINDIDEILYSTEEYGSEGGATAFIP